MLFVTDQISVTCYDDIGGRSICLKYIIVIYFPVMFQNQFERHRGQCGVCGDPWQGPREHEAGGKYARGLVAKQYKTGAFINVTVELTSNHKGYFEFRLCPVNDPHKKATHACLDKHLLNIVGHGTRYFITRGGANVYIEMIVMLPPKLKCSQCVLQWKWVAGTSIIFISFHLWLFKPHCC